MTRSRTVTVPPRSQDLQRPRTVALSHTVTGHASLRRSHTQCRISTALHGSLSGLTPSRVKRCFPQSRIATPPARSQESPAVTHGGQSRTVTRRHISTPPLFLAGSPGDAPIQSQGNSRSHRLPRHRPEVRIRRRPHSQRRRALAQAAGAAQGPLGSGVRHGAARARCGRATQTAQAQRRRPSRGRALQRALCACIVPAKPGKGAGCTSD